MAIPTAAMVEQALKLLNGLPYMDRVRAVVILLTAATAAIVKWTGNLPKIEEDIKKLSPGGKATVTDKQRITLLKDLNKVVLQEVTERLDKSLPYRIQMDLHRDLQMQRVGRPDVPERIQPPELIDSRSFNPFSASADSADSAKPIDNALSTRELFEHPDIHGRLLILGEPGAGKTTELLALAKDLLQQAQQANNHPIPIIFELSAWLAEPNKTLADWFMAQLKDQYDIPLEVSERWLDQNKILPLLDGLDELRRVDDADGMTSAELDRLQQAQQVQCIRDINTYLDTYTQTSLVVCCRRKEYEALEQQGEKLRRLQGAIYLQSLSDQQIEAYCQKTERPHLWIALEDQPELLELARSPLFLLMLIVVYQGQTIQSKAQLLDAYIDKRLADLDNQGAYPPGRAPTAAQTHHYLSWLAIKLKENETTEFLIGRLQPSWLERKGDRLLYRWGVGLLFGLINGLIYGLIWGLIWGPIWGLINGLFFGLTDGLRGGLRGGLLTFSWRKALGVLMSWLRVGLRVGLIFGLIVGLRGGLIVGLIFGLMGGLMGVLMGVLMGGFSGGFSGELIAVIQHGVLRGVLFRSGLSPRNYKLFMEHAENHRFIQRVGGRYRFVHDLLRTRFAERYQPRQRKTKT